MFFPKNRAGSLMIMMRVGGIMQTSLSLAPLMRGDHVSFTQCVFEMCNKGNTARSISRTQFYHRKVVFLCIFKTVYVLMQMSVLRFHIDSLAISIQHKLFQAK